MLQHVSIETRPGDVDACVRFYELIGFRRVEPPPSLAERAAWVERGGTQIHLLYAEEPAVPGAGHTAVVVEDFERTFSTLEPFSPERRTAHWGAARAVVTSPAGHRVEFMAAPPGATPA